MKRQEGIFSGMSKQIALSLTQKVRQKIFEKEEDKVYKTIVEAANRGNYYVDFICSEDFYEEEVDKLRKELISKGFNVKPAEIAGKRGLKIMWFPEKNTNTNYM
ncbi:MAG: hypothetical protein GX196_06240 [Clostridiaceae bacterium]|nr:hypothetical protein [Clostridiaceae bacterium]